ncbi:hypothetical protein ACJMK2_031676 [Sinanodonta woodiana]|uniref:BHLH domain-containing protein n=1 Tax=Sinanodonta woodiana TaxID=1069815 RepID=A0ABD3X1M6_SINWO
MSTISAGTEPASYRPETEDIYSNCSFSDSAEEQSGGDEERPRKQNSYVIRRSRLSKSRVPETVRLRINDRERQRMHDLNTALDSLREVMPFSNGSSAKKLSKMATLLLARNYIAMLNKSVEEMRKIIQDLTTRKAVSYLSYPDISGMNRHLLMPPHLTASYSSSPIRMFLPSGLDNVSKTSTLPCLCSYCQSPPLSIMQKPVWKPHC